MPLTIDDCKLIKKAITLIDNNNNGGNKETARVLKKVQNSPVSHSVVGFYYELTSLVPSYISANFRAKSKEKIHFWPESLNHFIDMT